MLSTYMSCMFTTGRCYVYIRWYKMFCVHMPLEGFYPPLVGSKPPGQPQPSPNWPMRNTYYLKLTRDWSKNFKEKSVGKTGELEKNTGVVNSPFESCEFLKGSKIHAFRLTYLLIFARNIYIYILHFFSEAEYFAESSYGIVFVRYIGVRILYLCNRCTSIYILKDAAQSPSTSDPTLRDPRSFWILEIWFYSLLCWIRITWWLVNLPPLAYHPRNNGLIRPY